MSINTKISYQFFDDILKRNNFEGKSAIEFGRFVYEATWMKYRMKFFEEKNRADKFMDRIIEKNKEIEGLYEKLQEVVKKYEEKTGERIDISAPSTSLTPSDS